MYTHTTPAHGLNRPLTWLLSTLAAIAIAAACNLDGPPDHQADWADSAAIKALQASQAGTARRNAAAQRVCLEARGPNSEARWTPDGDLVCTTRRGVRQPPAGLEASL